jgi:DnaJ-class molecular chaperone
MNYYEVLGVDKTASADAIKKGYKRMAAKYHPDRQGGSSKAMVLVNKAHDTLSDPQKRAFYDLHGEDEPQRPPIETQALQLIYNIILQIADQVDDDFNFVGALHENLSANRRNIANSEPKLRSMLRKAERQKTKIRRKKKDSGENLLTRVFDQKIAQIKAKIADIPNALVLADAALKILTEYEYAGEVDSRRDKRPDLGGLLQQMLKQGYGP